MIFCSVILAVLTVLYAALMVIYRIGWSLQPAFIPTPGTRPDVSVSIVIPARNEAANIVACIESILAQHYPKHLTEIIVADDCSDDDTAEIVARYSARGVQCIRMRDVLTAGEVINAFKKKALAAAIAHSRGELIITTDADCIAPPDWLRTIAAFYRRTGAAMIAAPVDFTTGASAVTIFQTLDFRMMQGITAASHRLKLGGMANGANLVFSRAAYEAVRGYEGTEHIASGDDYLLLAKMKKVFPDGIYFLKSRAAIVRTLPQPTWTAFLQQRIRWASKSGKYPDARLTVILLIVYVFNVGWLSAFIAGVSNKIIFGEAVIILAVKIFFETALLWPVSVFFGRRRLLIYFPLLQVFHIFYISLAGFLGLFGKYSWKGRLVK